MGGLLVTHRVSARTRTLAFFSILPLPLPLPKLYGALQATKGRSSGGVVYLAQQTCNSTAIVRAIPMPMQMGGGNARMIDPCTNAYK